MSGQSEVRGIYGFAGSDTVEGLALSAMLGARLWWVGSDGMAHTGTVSGVFPWDGHESVAPVGAPMLSVSLGYSATFVSASNFAQYLNGGAA